MYKVYELWRDHYGSTTKVYANILDTVYIDCASKFLYENISNKTQGTLLVTWGMC